MKKILLSIITITAFGLGANGQNVNIPDANFKVYLVGNTAINTNADAEIQVSEANAFTGPMLVNNLSITNFTGLQEFTSLTNLTIANNSIATVDVSSNISLDSLTLTNNAMTSVDVSSNTALIYFRVSHNDLTQVDVSNLTNLITLACDYNQLTSVNLTGAVALDYLNCPWNNLVSIDLSNNVNLTKLYCQRNSLTSLDVSNNVNLTMITATINPLGSLDVSNNTLLEELELYDCSLNSLNMANGNNTIIAYLDVTVNPDLTCINVDDAAYSTSNWTNVDATASFSEICSFVGVNEQANNINFSIYPNPTTSQITISIDEKIKSIIIMDIMGKAVKTIVSMSNTITTSDLTEGIYFLQVQTDKGLVSKKFIKK